MEFPCVVTKGEFKYVVDSQAALDFHLSQGWALQSVENYTGATAEQVEEWGKSVNLRLSALEHELAAATSALRTRVSTLESAPFPVDIEAVVKGILDRDIPGAIETAVKKALDRDVPEAADGNGKP